MRSGRAAFIAAALLAAAAPGSAEENPYALQGGQSCEATAARINAGVEAGDRRAMLAAGLLLEEGLCGDPDAKRAAAFYQRASDRGEKTATRRLAWLFALGKGVPQDYATAGALMRDEPPGADDKLTIDDYRRGYERTWLALARDKLRERNSPISFRVSVHGPHSADPEQLVYKFEKFIAVNRSFAGSARNSPTEIAKEALVEAAKALPPVDRSKLSSELMEFDVVVDATGEVNVDGQAIGGGHGAPSAPIPTIYTRQR